MLTWCHSCGSDKGDKKPAATGEATEAQKKELKYLETIKALQIQVGELNARLASHPVAPTGQPIAVQPAAPSAAPSTLVFPINRINAPSKRDSQQVMNLKSQIRSLTATIKIKTANWVGNTDAVAHQVGLANINELEAQLADMKALLADIEASQQ